VTTDAEAKRKPRKNPQKEEQMHDHRDKMTMRRRQRAARKNLTRALSAAVVVMFLVGCAPLVRYSECETGGPPCPTGTTCQQVSGQHAVCTTECTATQACDGAARCFQGPYANTSGIRPVFCRLPCDAALQCPAGLSCMMGETVDGVGLWCM
jgi:hypothetical protein